MKILRSANPNPSGTVCGCINGLVRDRQEEGKRERERERERERGSGSVKNKTLERE